VEIVTFAEIQKVTSSFEFKNSISSIGNCNEFRFFEPRFTSLNTIISTLNSQLHTVHIVHCTECITTFLIYFSTITALV